MISETEFKEQYEIARKELGALMRAWDARDAEPVTTLTVALVMMISSVHSLFENEEDVAQFVANCAERGRKLYEEVEGMKSNVH